MSQDESRRDHRKSVIQAGKVVFGNAVFDCLVLDIAPTGARVRFSIPVAIPETVVLRMREGTSYPAARRWSRGTEVGLEFTGPPIVESDEIRGRQATVALELLRGGDLARCFDALQRERFFGDETLRNAAEAARDAHAHLEDTLKKHAARPARRPRDEPY